MSDTFIEVQSRSTSTKTRRSLKWHAEIQSRSTCFSSKHVSICGVQVFVGHWHSASVPFMTSLVAIHTAIFWSEARPYAILVIWSIGQLTSVQLPLSTPFVSHRVFCKKSGALLATIGMAEGVGLQRGRYEISALGGLWHRRLQQPVQLYQPLYCWSAVFYSCDNSSLDERAHCSMGESRLRQGPLVPRI